MPSPATAHPSRGQLPSEAAAWRWAILLTLILGLIFLKAYLGVIILAFLVAYIFYPLHERFKRRIRHEGLAISATTLVSLLAAALPIAIILLISVTQAITLIDNLGINRVDIGGSTLNDKALTLSHGANGAIERAVGIHNAISDKRVADFLQTTLPDALRNVVSATIRLVSGIPGFFTMLIIYLFVFTAALSKGPQIVDLIKKLSPFSGSVNSLYINRVSAMATAMIKGQLLIALVQGVESAVVIALVGFAGYFWFMAILFTFLSFIPLGAGIITIPLGIVMILFGNVAGGIVVLLNHFLVVTNIDNYIRPKVVPKEASLPAALTMLGAFAGVGYFGFLGVIYGPIIMIVLLTTVQTYVEQKTRLSQRSSRKLTRNAVT